MNLADLHEHVGTELGVSAWETLAQPRIDRFAECTGDHQWIHVDVERARAESPLRATIAHGYLLLSLIAPSTFEVLTRPLGVAQALNYGLDKVRFLSPVKVGSRVRNRIRLLSIEDKGQGRLLIATENTIEIDGETRPALIAAALVLVTGA
ncbi:MaoC family dehydratase [Scleromatobacter humisilvae]|uniref:MaoC family dehydratase n=1 Tax=Scleromatobacter humisilvae TaxID=2897159 RepID=A0A9X2C4J7_9BURK|nr:MaoC family dehydratase [Scleromatobacter humisilvae]MCK9689765.1 MaoC family dehydratase [Scleromatobacter humisilvae]